MKLQKKKNITLTQSSPSFGAKNNLTFLQKSQLIYYLKYFSKFNKNYSFFNLKESMTIL